MPLDTLRRYWGYDSFRPGQREVIDSVLSGCDTIGLMPTGGGKSVTFQVPAMMMSGLTVVVTPLISLMKDQVDNLASRGIRAAYIHSGLTRREITLAFDRCRLGKARLLYISPERLRRREFVDLLKQWSVSLIVVDEAHCISQWGYDFRPSYLNIGCLRDAMPDVPVLALTASATPEVVADIASQLRLRSPRVLSRSFTRDNISYIVRRDEDKLGRMVRVLSNTAGSAIVYVRSRRRCRELADYLTSHGISATWYHAGLSPDEKTVAQDSWRDGRVRVMVATNAFGMGIDKADVRVVLHYDLPSSLEEYYQEAGRGGRDGKPSFAVLVAAKTDKALLTRRINESFPPKDFIREVYDRLGVWFDLAVGEGYGKIFEFSLTAFCTRFGYSPAPVASAMNILTRAGYIEYADDAGARARVMVLAPKHEFYSFELDLVSEAVLQTIMRKYTGLFADYVEIDESVVARGAGITPDQVYQSLLAMTRLHLLHYIPRRLLPYVFYPTARDMGRNLVIPRSVYEVQRERTTRRIEAMRHYAFSDDTCRNTLILDYFGERNAADCGRCDVCRRRSKSRNVDLTDKILEAIRQAGGTLDVTALTKAFPHDTASATDAVRRLADSGKVALSGTEITLIS